MSSQVDAATQVSERYCEQHRHLPVFAQEGLPCDGGTAGRGQQAGGVLDHCSAAGGRGRVRKEPGHALREQAHAVVVRTKNGLLSEHAHAAPERNVPLASDRHPGGERTIVAHSFMLAPPSRGAHMQAFTYMSVIVWWWDRSGEPHRGAPTCDAVDCRPCPGPSRARRRRQVRPVVTGQPHVPCGHTTGRAHLHTSWPKRPRRPSGRRGVRYHAAARGRAPHTRGPERRHHIK